MKNKRLKICFIGWANSEHVKRWVKWFAERGHEVHLISNIYEEIPGVNVHSFQDRTTSDLSEDRSANKTWFSEMIANIKFNYLSYLRYPGYIRRTKDLLAEIRPDILQGFYIGFAGYIGAFTGFHPFLVFTGGPDLLVFPRRSIIHRLWTMYALSKIDFLTHTSEEANLAAVKFGFPAARSKFMHIGIDLSMFNPEVDPGDLKTRLGIAGHPMILSTRGLFDKYYNISGLLKTFALVLEEIPETRLVLKYYSAPEKNKLIKLAQNLDIYDKIIWVGRTEYSDLPKFYRAADIYISLSFTDSGPVSMLEAMACGSVPVMSNLSNIAEWVKDGENGYLVEPNDNKAAAAAIIKLINDRGSRVKMGLKNVDIIREFADQEKCFGEIEKVSLNLVAKKNEK